MAEQFGGELAALKRTVAAVEKSLAARDRLIVETAKANVPVPKIAEAVGLSRARIYQIIAEQSA